MNRAHKLNTRKRAATIYHEDEKQLKPERRSIVNSLFWSYYYRTEQFFPLLTWFLCWYWILCKKRPYFASAFLFTIDVKNKQIMDLLCTYWSSAEMRTLLSWTLSCDTSASCCFFCLADASWNIRTPHQILQAQPMMIQANPNWSIPVIKTAQSHPGYSTSVQLAITVPSPIPYLFHLFCTRDHTVDNKIGNRWWTSNLRDSQEITISVRFLCNICWHRKNNVYIMSQIRGDMDNG